MEIELIVLLVVVVGIGLLALAYALGQRYGSKEGTYDAGLPRMFVPKNLNPPPPPPRLSREERIVSRLFHQQREVYGLPDEIRLIRYRSSRKKKRLYWPSHPPVL